HWRYRRDHRIGSFDGSEVGGQRRATPAHRLEIGHGGYRQSGLQPHQDLRAIILRPFDHPALVEGSRLGREHALAGRGELALIRLTPPTVVCKPVTPQNCAGNGIEPPVSEPSAAKVRRAPTAEPDPDDEPPVT